MKPWSTVCTVLFPRDCHAVRKHKLPYVERPHGKFLSLNEKREMDGQSPPVTDHSCLIKTTKSESLSWTLLKFLNFMIPRGWENREAFNGRFLRIRHMEPCEKLFYLIFYLKLFTWLQYKLFPPLANCFIVFWETYSIHPY